MISASLTEECGECDQPCADVRQCLNNLLLLELLVLRAALVVSHTLERSDTLLFGQETRMHRGVWEPEDDARPNDDGEASKHDVEDLVR